ncbi:MAG: TonB family protein [Pseudomonadota bacterium]
MHVTVRQLLIAVMLAVLVHAGVAAAMFWEPEPPGAVASGIGGIDVSLGPTGGAPGSVATPAPPLEAQEAVVEEAEVVEVVETTAETLPVDETVEITEPVEPNAIVAVDAAADVAEPVDEAAVIATDAIVEAADLTATVKPDEVAEAVPVPPIPLEAPTTVASLAEATPAPQVSAPVPAEVESDAEPTISEDAPSVAGSAGQAGSQDSPDAGHADDVSGGGYEGSAADYMAYLLAWLEKHKTYPREAQSRNQEGTVLLYLEMGRAGEVHAFRIHDSSGHQRLDDEVLALIRRAEPLPPPPPEVEGDRIKLLVPVEFFLK